MPYAPQSVSLSVPKTEPLHNSALKKALLCMGGLVCLALVVCILGLCSSVAAAETPLTDEQLRELLFELAQQQTDGGEFLVVPEDFRMPEVGADGEFRLLILGVDTDRAGFRGRSDTMILAVFNVHEESLHLISFMRDLYVKIPGRGHNRLNAAYAYGGSSLLRRLPCVRTSVLKQMPMWQWTFLR